MKTLLLFAAGGVLFLASCTERRKDTPPVPNGDTVEVVIPSDSPVAQIDTITLNQEIQL